MSLTDKIHSMSIKHERTIFLAIILLGLIIRLYGITLPLIESHQVRQAQTAMMTRNLYEDHLDIFHTRLDFFGNVPGYIIMEFPLMHTITALLYTCFGVHEILGRLVSIAFSVGAMFLFYGLARQFLSVLGALSALILYTFSPMNIFFSRAFMPESSMMFFMVGSIYFILKWLDKQTWHLYLTAIVFTALAGLTKPTAGLIFIPIFTAWFLKYHWKLWKRFDFWFYFFLSGIPTVVWALYAHFFNAKIPYLSQGFGNWLEVITNRGGIIAHWIDPKFYKFVGGSISVLLLTPLGFIAAVIGVFCAKNAHRVKILYSWLGAVILYFYILAGANSGHIYYHLPLLPIAAIFFGFSVQWVLDQPERLKKFFEKKPFLLLARAAIFIIICGYLIGYYKYFQYMYSVRLPYVLEVSEIIKKHSPKNRFIIDNGSGLLTAVISYYSKSKAQFFIMVAPSAIEDLKYWRAQGATTFVTMETQYDPKLVPAQIKNKEFWEYLNQTATPIALTDHYQIFDLTTRLPTGEKK